MIAPYPWLPSTRKSGLNFSTISQIKSLGSPISTVASTFTLLTYCGKKDHKIISTKLSSIKIVYKQLKQYHHITSTSIALITKMSRRKTKIERDLFFFTKLNSLVDKLLDLSILGSFHAKHNLSTQYVAYPSNPYKNNNNNPLIQK